MQFNVRFVAPIDSTFPARVTDAMGGVIRAQLELARALNAMGSRMQLVCYNRGGLPAREVHDFGELYRINKWKKFRIGNKDLSYLFPAFLWALRKRRCDVLHVHNDPYLLYLPRTKKKVFHLHGYLGEEMRSRPFRRALERADAVICVSKFTREKFLRATKFSREKTFVVYNGVDPGISLKVDGGILRGQLGINESDIVLTYIGQIQEEKGLTFLIEAFKQVSKMKKNIHLLIAGSSRLWRGSAEADEYELQAREMSRGLRIHFLGKIPVVDVINVYAASDIFVLPSLTEGLPLTVLEALAAGKPVIASRVGGVPEIVENGRNGILVPPGNAASLIDAINKLVEDEKLRKSLGKEGREMAGRFTWENAAREIINVYKKILI